MRRFLVTAAALAALFVLQSREANAQLGNGVGADPFSFYYGYYLPHQAYMAAQPRVSDSINQVVATRQYNAQTDRSSLYDPISPYGGEADDDALRPYSPARGGDRAARGGGGGGGAMTFGTASSSTQSGSGPALYYNRTARYFPTLRTGRGPNRNLAAVRGNRGGGGGMPSMPGGGMGMPGPR